MTVSILQSFENNLYPSQFNAQSHANKELRIHEKKRRIHASVATGTAIGVGSALMLLAKGRGYSLNPKNIIKTPLKDMAVFKMPYEEGAICVLSGASIAGGLLGGIAVDKKNTKAKLREAVIQVANVLTPLGCIFVTRKSFAKVAPKIANKFVKDIARIGSILGALTVGILAANKIGNEINEKVYHKPMDRRIMTKDFSPHLDDMCLAASLIGIDGKNMILKGISRVIPLALLVTGNSVGRASETKEAQEVRQRTRKQIHPNKGLH